MQTLQHNDNEVEQGYNPAREVCGAYRELCSNGKAKRLDSKQAKQAVKHMRNARKNRHND